MQCFIYAGQLPEGGLDNVRTKYNINKDDELYTFANVQEGQRETIVKGELNDEDTAALIKYMEAKPGFFRIDLDCAVSKDNLEKIVNAACGKGMIRIFPDGDINGGVIASGSARPRDKEHQASMTRDFIKVVEDFYNKPNGAQAVKAGRENYQVSYQHRDEIKANMRGLNLELDHREKLFNSSTPKPQLHI